jgi:hypothetical protein
MPVVRAAARRRYAGSNKPVLFSMGITIHNVSAEAWPASEAWFFPSSSTPPPPTQPGLRAAAVAPRSHDRRSRFSPFRPAYPLSGPAVLAQTPVSVRERLAVPEAEWPRAIEVGLQGEG